MEDIQFKEFPAQKGAVLLLKGKAEMLYSFIVLCLCVGVGNVGIAVNKPRRHERAGEGAANLP